MNIMKPSIVLVYTKIHSQIISLGRLLKKLHRTVFRGKNPIYSDVLTNFIKHQLLRVITVSYDMSAPPQLT